MRKQHVLMLSSANSTQMELPILLRRWCQIAYRLRSLLRQILHGARHRRSFGFAVQTPKPNLGSPISISSHSGSAAMWGDDSGTNNDVDIFRFSYKIYHYLVS